MTFKIQNCDFGFVYKGVSYDFLHVAELQVEDPRRKHLTRGSNAKDKIGLVYEDGLTEPVKWTLPILEMSAALKAVMDEAFNTSERLDPYCIDRKDGSKKMLKNAILSNQPQQLTINETAESMNVSLEFESFDPDETHKS
jgi:hypothetical protein